MARFDFFSPLGWFLCLLIDTPLSVSFTSRCFDGWVGRGGNVRYMFPNCDCAEFVIGELAMITLYFYEDIILYDKIV